jgi:hypothetical protein
LNELKFEWRWPDAYSEVRAPSNARLSKKGNSWFEPKISAALVSKHHWLIIASGTCGFIRATGGLGARDAS